MTAKKMDCDTAIKLLLVFWILCKFVKVFRPSHDYGEEVKIYVEQNEQYADGLRTDFEYCQSCFHRIKTFLLDRKSDLGLVRAWKIKEKVIFT